MPIRTERLDLVPGTFEILEAELRGRAPLAKLLDIEVPESWPPPLYDADAIRWMLGRLGEEPGFEAWGFRYFVLRGEAGSVAVGAGGYKGPPTDDGTVEIGYSILPEYQRRGFASEAVEGLVARAFEDSRASRVLAETLPDLSPSIGVLEKTGFKLLGDGSEPGVIRYGRER